MLICSKIYLLFLPELYTGGVTGGVTTCHATSGPPGLTMAAMDGPPINKMECMEPHSYMHMLNVFRCCLFCRTFMHDRPAVFEVHVICDIQFHKNWLVCL